MNCKNSVLACVLNLSPIVPDWVLSPSDFFLVPLSSFSLKHVKCSHILSKIFKMHVCLHVIPGRVESEASFY